MAEGGGSSNPKQVDQKEDKVLEDLPQLDPIDGVTQDEETDPRLWVRFSSLYVTFYVPVEFTSLCALTMRY